MSDRAGLEVSISTHSRPGRAWAKITAYSAQQGRYGSVVCAVVDLDPDNPPRDAEELVAVLLANLGAVAYG